LIQLPLSDMTDVRRCSVSSEQRPRVGSHTSYQLLTKSVLAFFDGENALNVTCGVQNADDIEEKIAGFFDCREVTFSNFDGGLLPKIDKLI
jgi:hypothetical protein